MNILKLSLLAVVATTLVACNDSVITPPVDNPPAGTMSFKQNARYEYESYSTNAATGQRTDTSARRRTWTLVNPSASIQGRTGVAIFVDSVFSAGGIFSVRDSVLLQQSGPNDVYRFASLAPELDFGGVALLDLGRLWMKEARLNATTANWVVGTVNDTIEADFGIPAVNRFLVAITDNAVASATESVTIGATSYSTTRTTHSLELSVSALITSTFGTIPVKVASKSLTRTSWVSQDLGAIVKEVREGVVLDASYVGQSFKIPVPGYYSSMTAVLATGG